MRPLHSQALEESEQEKASPGGDKQNACTGVQIRSPPSNDTEVQHDLLLAQVRQRIKRLRLERNLRQEDMAEKLQWNLRYYQRFESQDTQEVFNPKIRMFLQVAEVLGITLAELFSPPETSLGQSPSNRRVSRKIAKKTKDQV